MLVCSMQMSRSRGARTCRTLMATSSPAMKATSRTRSSPSPRPSQTQRARFRARLGAAMVGRSRRQVSEVDVTGTRFRRGGGRSGKALGCARTWTGEGEITAVGAGASLMGWPAEDDTTRCPVEACAYRVDRQKLRPRTGCYTQPRRTLRGYPRCWGEEATRSQLTRLTANFERDGRPPATRLAVARSDSSNFWAEGPCHDEDLAVSHPDDEHGTTWQCWYRPLPAARRPRIAQIRCNVRVG
jgi:hypothetical protein